MIIEKDKNSALIAHISGFGSYFFTFGSVLFPFIIRELKKNDSAYIDSVTKDVVNFNLSYLLYTILVKLFVVPLFVGSIFESGFTNHLYFDFDGDKVLGIISLGTVLSIFAIIKFVLIIKAIISTNKGVYFKYPYTIEFVK